jgi:hypothetical protein
MSYDGIIKIAQMEALKRLGISTAQTGLKKLRGQIAGGGITPEDIEKALYDLEMSLPTEYDIDSELLEPTGLVDLKKRGLVPPS